MKPVKRSRAVNFSRTKIWKSVTGAILSTALLASAQQANAGAELKLGDESGVTVGFGIRNSYTSVENGAPNGTSRSNDFSVENARLYLSGHYGKIIKATFNTERTGGPAATGGDSIRVMDAIVQFEFMPEFNIWMGRMLPPSDRANLYGPFFALPWSYPGVASNYPNLAVGRDNGAMIWGKPFGGKLVYSVGAFEGHNKAATLSGASDKLLYAGRLAFNIWDPEPAPAHYTGGWYGGSKDIFTVALAGFMQKDGVGTAAAPGKLKIWNADLLIEKKFAAGVPTFEAAYYKYKLGAVDCGSGEPGSPACGVVGADNIGGQVDGKSYLVSAAFLFSPKIGWGQFQPFIRYQKFDRSLSNTTNKATDFGINYIIKGPNAKVSAVYTKSEDSARAPGAQERDMFTLGVQLQY
jgi:hypothetical protein